MRHITSQLREAATRRRMIDAGDAPADHSTYTTQIGLVAHTTACWAELMAARLRHVAFHSRPSFPPGLQITPTARASSDFTAQVMARLTTPPPEPDPREARARRVRAHVRHFARIYMALVLASGVALLLLATLAPWTLLDLLGLIVTMALMAMSFAAFVSHLTDGVISGFGVAYVAMLVALALALLARRTARGRYASTRRL